MRAVPRRWAVCVVYLLPFTFFLIVVSGSPQAPPPATHKYDLLLRGGYVIDPRNRVSGVRDVGIFAGKIAAVAVGLDPADALKTVDVPGLYVSPGLVDIHGHV